MKGWLFLVIAIVGEVIATFALKSSEGFTKLAPSAVVIIGYGIAYYFLSLVETLMEISKRNYSSSNVGTLGLKLEEMIDDYAKYMDSDPKI